MDENTGTGVPQVRESGLATTNPRVVAVAQRLRMSPDRLVAQVKRHLPAVVEQELYLALVDAQQVTRPETFAKLLRAFLGHQTLEAHHLISRPVGPNLVVNRFDQVAEFVTGVIQLCRKELQMSDFTITFEVASQLMLEYGTVERAEAMIDSIIADIGPIRERLRYHGMSDGKAVSFAINYLVKHIIPVCKLAGRPLPSYFMEHFEERDRVPDVADDEE